MAIISTLSVSLTARTDQFAKAMRSASADLQTFAGKVKSISGRMIKFSTVGLGSAAVALGVLARKSMNTLDRVGVLSDVLNIATEDLIAYRLAAREAGASNNDLDKSLKAFVTRLGIAQNTGAGVTKVLKQLGLTSEELIKQGTAEAFGTVADEINKMGNVSQKAAAIFALFGRQGLKIGALMQRGSKGLKEARIEAGLLGLTISRLDASKIQEADDAIIKLKASFTAVGNKLAVELSPTIIGVSNLLVDFAKNGINTGEFVSDAFNKIVDVVATLAGSLDLLSAAWNGFIGVISKTINVGGKAIKFVADKINDLGFIIKGEAFFETTTLDKVIKRSGEQAEKSFNKASKAMDDFLKGKRPKALQEFYSELIRKINLLAELRLKIPPPPSIEPPFDRGGKDGAGRGRRDSAIEVSRSRFFIGGIEKLNAQQAQRVQKTKDKNSDEQTKLLKKIAVNTGGNAVAVTI